MHTNFQVLLKFPNLKYFLLLGHMQQGGSPTPYDRNLGTKMAAKAVNWISETLKANACTGEKVICNNPESAVLLGIVRRQYKFTNLLELKEQTNFEYA